MSSAEFKNTKSSEGDALVYALIGLCVFLYLVFKAKYATFFEQLIYEFNSNSVYFYISIVTLTLAFLLKASFVLSTVGFFRSGNRLRAYAGLKKKGVKSVLEAQFFIVFLTLASLFITEYIIELNKQRYIIYTVFMYANLYVGWSLSVHFYSHIFTEKNVRGDKLKKYKPEDNKIRIGTEVLIEESEDGEKKEHEISHLLLNKNQLKENILITGQIGTGKTSGLILPIVDQILSNFSDPTFVCCIDPKHTFIKSVKKMVLKKHTSKKLIHISFDNNITFNPIYVKDVLKNGRYVEVSSMIQSATTNFVGGEGGGNDKFWTYSSQSLIKYTLIYLASFKCYYTLKDFYQVLLEVSAVQDEETTPPHEKIAVILEENEFDAEETYNIETAYSYFKDVYSNMDSKIKSSIFATATVFLEQLNEFNISRIFCPEEKDLTIHSIDNLVNEDGILLFDIKSPALSKPMCAIMKILVQGAILKRTSLPEWGTKEFPLAFIVIDEAQQVVSSGGGHSMGDDRFLSMSREPGACSIYATQSLTSIRNTLKSESATNELIQNFRTWVFCSNTDALTIKAISNVAGKVKYLKQNRTVGESSSNANKGLLTTDFKSEKFNLSESISFVEEKKDLVSANRLATLGKFEAYAFISGVKPKFTKMFLKPIFLKDINTNHQDLLKLIQCLVLFVLMGSADLSKATPNVCDIVSSTSFTSCMEERLSTCTCGYPPHPCQNYQYYIPYAFVEVVANPKKTFFSGYSFQNIKETRGAGNISDNGFFYTARTITIPYSYYTLNNMACGGARMEKYCYDIKSGDLGNNWLTGKADMNQLQFKAWTSSPNSCLQVGAVSGAAGNFGGIGAGLPSCSFKTKMDKYPPSQHPQCTGWGFHFPRVGYDNNPQSTISALNVGARILSLGKEVMMTLKGGPLEKWQMIYPQKSSCFKEGKNPGILELGKAVNDAKRTKGKMDQDYLFVVWKQVSCCKEYTTLVSHNIVKAALMGVCQGGSSGNN